MAIKPDNLVIKIGEFNAAKGLSRKTPSLKEVEKWVAEAKEFPRILEH